MILGAMEAARAADRVVLLMNTEGNGDLEARELAAALLRYQVDGVLYATMSHRSVEVPALLHNTPIVLLDAEAADPTVSWAVPDEVAGAMTAAGELRRARPPAHRLHQQPGPHLGRDWAVGGLQARP